MKNITAIRSLAIPFVLVFALATPAQADDDLAANPYRPSVGSPASLSAPGHFEVEAGFARESASEARQDSVPMLLKYAFTDRFGVSFGISPWLRVRAQDASVSGNSDGTVTLKFGQPVNDALMLGGELTASLPVASYRVGSKHSDITLNLIASSDFAGFHGDVNVNSTRLGDRQEAGVSRRIIGWSAGVSHPLTDRLGAGLEVSGIHQGGTDISRQWLAALSYALGRKLVVDLYAAREQVGGIHISKFGFGFTYLVAR